jgi:hypothetical protein
MPKLPTKHISPGTANVGDVLSWNGTSWVPIAPPGVGAILTNTRFVDVSTTVPAADQTGTIEAPFDSLTDAIADLSGGGLIIVVPGDYSAEGTIALGVNKYAICNIRTFTGYASARPEGLFSANEDSVQIAALTGITIGTGSQDPQTAVLISLQGLMVGTFSGDNNLRVYDCQIGIINATSFEAEHTQMLGRVELNVPTAVTWLYLDRCDLISSYGGGANWLVAHTNQLDGCLFTLRDCNIGTSLAVTIEVDTGGTGSVRFDTMTYDQWVTNGILTSVTLLPMPAATSLMSVTTKVDVSAATAPALGQVLTAVDSTHATWQNPVVLPAWHTLLDMDFSAQTTQTFTGDGNVTIGGVVFVVENFGNQYSGTSMGVTNGSGLRLPCQASGAAYEGASGRVAPLLRFPFTASVINNVPVRAVMVPYPVVNPLNGVLYLAIEYPSSTYRNSAWFKCNMPATATTFTTTSLGRMMNSAQDNVISSEALETGADVVGLYYPNGAGSVKYFEGLGGKVSNNAYADTSKLCTVGRSGTTQSYATLDSATVGLAQNWGVALSVYGSFTVQHFYVKQLKVEAFY